MKVVTWYGWEGMNTVRRWDWSSFHLDDWEFQLIMDEVLWNVTFLTIGSRWRLYRLSRDVCPRDALRLKQTTLNKYSALTSRIHPVNTNQTKSLQKFCESETQSTISSHLNNDHQILGFFLLLFFFFFFFFTYSPFSFLYFFFFFSLILLTIFPYSPFFVMFFFFFFPLLSILSPLRLFFFFSLIPLTIFPYSSFFVMFFFSPNSPFFFSFKHFSISTFPFFFFFFCSLFSLRLVLFFLMFHLFFFLFLLLHICDSIFPFVLLFFLYI